MRVELDDMKVANKILVVTGAGSGIGREVAVRHSGEAREWQRSTSPR